MIRDVAPIITITKILSTMSVQSGWDSNRILFPAQWSLALFIVITWYPTSLDINT